MKNPENNTNQMGPASVSREARSFTVPASPLNGVKLDLGILLIIGLGLILLLWKLQPVPFIQGMILAVYGLAAMFWLILRTRRILSRWEKTGSTSQDEDKG